MVPGVPYAIAAKFAYPERPVIGVSGDGAFQMLGMNELLTVVHYAKELLTKNPTLIFCVLVNEDLNQVSFEQRVMASDPINFQTQAVPYVPAAEFAKMLGFEGIKVTKPEDVGPAWERALAADGPVLLEFVADPTVPPLPPHVKPEQMKKTLKAFAAGDPQATQIGWKGFKGKWSEFAEHAKDKLPGSS
jgi:pyruvate dehydrogenase (quinone)